MSKKYRFIMDSETLEYAREVLGETDEVREKCLIELKEYLNENVTINARTDDLSLLAFLRGSKFDLEKTKTKIKNYYGMRARINEWFGDRNPLLPELQELINLGVFIPIPQQDPGPMIVIIRTAVHNPSIHKQSDVFKIGKMILDLAVRDFEPATVYGVYAIFDMNNVTFAHAKQLPPSVIRNAVFAWQNYHIRPQYLEFVNAPVYINVVLNVFKSFMTRKLKQRIHVHFSGFDNLHKIVPKEMLPEEYGGSNGNLQTLIEYWKNKLHDNVEWFKEDEKYKSILND